MKNKAGVITGYVLGIITLITSVLFCLIFLIPSITIVLFSVLVSFMVSSLAHVVLWLLRTCMKLVRSYGMPLAKANSALCAEIEQFVITIFSGQKGNIPSRAFHVILDSDSPRLHKLLEIVILVKTRENRKGHLTGKKLAQYMGCSERHVRRLIQEDGNIKIIRGNGRVNRYQFTFEPNNEGFPVTAMGSIEMTKEASDLFESMEEVAKN